MSKDKKNKYDIDADQPMSLKQSLRNQAHVYCSLDIETSGFDPAKDEILEVGFVFFAVGETGLKILEEYSQVFKPQKPVSPAILALTGITPEELNTAPSFSEHRERIQSKLQQAWIVGHNVGFDVKFLQAFGVQFEGRIIDTLDLVQFLLPTHHSYNLENLMHYFGIRHKEAHRALADAKAALLVLERLLKIYQSFPPKLKKEIEGLIQDRDFAWQPLFSAGLFKSHKEQLLSPKRHWQKHLSKKPQSGPQRIKIQPKVIYSLTVEENYLECLADIAGTQSEKVMLVVPKLSQVMQLWRQGLVQPILASQDLFDEKRFFQFLTRKDLTPEEVKFALKILVWKHTNWQTLTILDLNLSFFGGQFRSIITGGTIHGTSRAKVLCTNHENFLQLSQKKLYKDRLVMISDLNAFERVVSSDISAKVSWGKMIFLLKSVYDPELEVGNDAVKDTVIQALAATDLFFGLVGAVLGPQDRFTAEYVEITPQLEDSPAFKKMRQAAEHYVDKMNEYNRKLQIKEIETVLENLNLVFQNQSNRIKWIELSERRCAFYNAPLEIKELVGKILKPYNKLIFVDNLRSGILFQYFSARLGLENFRTETVAEKVLLPKPDLFSQRPQTRQINFELKAKHHSDEDLVSLIQKENLPAVVLFGSLLDLKQFHERYYAELKTRATLLTQISSGGGNKLFRNFHIHKDSLLLVSDKFVLRYLNNRTNLESVERVPVKTLIICRLPFEQFSHPYQRALAATFENAFLQFSLPRAIYAFHALLQFFYSPQLRQILVFDSKLDKDYAQEFKNYLELFANSAPSTQTF